MIDINKKEDIIIPFEKIGDNDWEVKTKIIIESLAENWSNELESPISIEEIDNLENRLGTTLPNGLKIFYNTFGIADIGEELQNFEDMMWLNIYGMKMILMDKNSQKKTKSHYPI